MPSAYLGPDKGRWTPATWEDVIAAAASGLLDETHWVDLKRELPTHKRTHNTELAQDLASLAVDSGLLVIGSTGSILWSFTTGGPVNSSPTVANGYLYVGSNDKNLYAFTLPAAAN